MKKLLLIYNRTDLDKQYISFSNEKSIEEFLLQKGYTEISYFYYDNECGYAIAKNKSGNQIKMDLLKIKGE